MKKPRKIKKLFSNVGLAVMISGIIPAATVFAQAELQATEFIGQVAYPQPIINVEAGSDFNNPVKFQILLQANGNLDQDATAKIYTKYHINADNTVTRYGEFNWIVSAGQGNRSQTVNAEVTADPNAKIGNSSDIDIVLGIINDGSGKQMLKNDAIDTLKFNVTKLADTVAPEITLVNPLNELYNASTLPMTFQVSLNETSEVFVNNLSQGTFTPGSFNLDLPTPEQGINSVSVYAKDTAGNNSEKISFSYFYDSIKPLVKATADRESNENGWYNKDVDVSFSATDENGSGIESVDTPVSVSTEGENQIISGKAIDKAGNIGTGSIYINLDKTKPVISSNLSLSPNNAGWYNEDVTVSFLAEDSLSGIASVSKPITLTEGKGQSVVGNALDKADNMDSVTVSGINIDKTNPVINVEDNSVYTLNQNVTWSASDALSGLATADKGSIDTSTVGNKSVTISATDNAGNTVEKTITYKVIYQFGGILQPINSNGSSTFKAGSTVPVKFQLTDSKGSYVSIAKATIYYAKYTSQVLGNETEAISTSAASIGNQFRYDLNDNQYIFNLSTKGFTAGTYLITIKLDDGTSRSVQISLK